MESDVSVRMEGNSFNLPFRRQIHGLEQISRPYSTGKTMRLVDLKGGIRNLPDYYVEELAHEQEIYGVCNRHDIAFFTRKSYKLHLKQEHAY
ncbi:MAG: hypothetical protein ACE5KA_08675 [Nitrososphaerales archaeon]